MVQALSSTSFAISNALISIVGSTIFRQHRTAAIERHFLHAILINYAAYACVFQFIGISSAVLFAFSGLGLLLGLSVDLLQNPKDGNHHVPLKTYAIGQTFLLVLGTTVFCLTTDIFVPLVSTQTQLSSAISLLIA